MFIICTILYYQHWYGDVSERNLNVHSEFYVIIDSNVRVPGYNLPDANEKNIKHKSFAVAKKNQNCMRFQKVRIQSKVFFSQENRPLFQE